MFVCTFVVWLFVCMYVFVYTIVDNVMRLFYDCPQLRNTRRRYTLLYVPVLRRNFESWKEAIKTLTDSTKYQVPSTKYQDVDRFSLIMFCIVKNMVNTNYQIIPSERWAFFILYKVYMTRPQGDCMR